ncbi:MAG: CHASE2 domain-containing protein [Cytophagaceae bacterium]
MKKLLRDSVGATIFTMVFLWILATAFSNINLEIVNPIGKVLSDFEITDVYFSHLKEKELADTNIVMVNIGDLDRAGIAELIDSISKYKPKVIGIDAFFRKPKNPESDSLLAAAFSRVENLVLVSKVLNPLENSEVWDSLELSHPMFSRHAESGMSNMISEGYDKFKTSREFPKMEIYRKKTPVYDPATHEIIKWNYKDTMELAFGAKLASYIDSNAIKKLLTRDTHVEVINFGGNFIPSEHVENLENSQMKYFALDIYDVLMDPDHDLSLVKDKIVIMGYMGPSFHKITWEDKFFTPLNPNYMGKANPDMYGVVVHANIVSMILNGNYINNFPDWFTIIINFVIIFLNIYFFGYLFVKLEHWYDGVTLVVTLIEASLFTGIIITVFHNYNYKIDLTFCTVALFLTGNLIELYHGFIVPLIDKIKIYFVNLRTSNKPSTI